MFEYDRCTYWFPSFQDWLFQHGCEQQSAVSKVNCSHLHPQREHQVLLVMRNHLLVSLNWPRNAAEPPHWEAQINNLWDETHRRGRERGRGRGKDEGRQKEKWGAGREGVEWEGRGRSSEDELEKSEVVRMKGKEGMWEVVERRRCRVKVWRMRNSKWEEETVKPVFTCFNRHSKQTTHVKKGLLTCDFFNSDLILPDIQTFLDWLNLFMLEAQTSVYFVWQTNTK